MISKREKQAWYILAFSCALFSAYWASTNSAKNGFKDYELGSKARYLNVSGADKLLKILQANIPKNYEAIHVNILTRHGSRNPTEKYFKMFDNLQSYLEENDKTGKTLALFQPFFSNLTGLVPAELALQGRYDLIGLGERVCSYWPNLCSIDWSDLYIEATYKERAYESAFWYLYGLLNLTSTDIDFGFSGPDDATAGLVYNDIEKLQKMLTFIINTEANDTTLRFFDHCKKYLVSVDDNKTALYQQTNFKNSSQFIDGVNLMSEKFCSEGQLCDMNRTMLDSVYYACSHAVMMFNDYNPCKYIPAETMQTYEYSGDLKDFYESYRGYNISYKSACYLVRVILNDIKRAVNSDVINRQQSGQSDQTESERSVYKHVIRAAHAETVLPILGIMDVVETDPLTANNYSPHRAYHSGLLIPMASNLIFTVYYSSKQQQPKRENLQTEDQASASVELNRNYDNYFVHVMLNEKILMLKGMNDPFDPLAPVPLKTFLKFMKSCDFEEFELMCELRMGA